MRLWTTIACLFGITGSLWSGTGENSKGNLRQALTPRRRGILKFDREQQRFIRYMVRPSDPDGSSDRRVTILYPDREGLIWVGLHRAKPNYFFPRAPTFQRFRLIAYRENR